MSSGLNRRDFLLAGTTAGLASITGIAGLAAEAPRAMAAPAGAPAVLPAKAARPVVISSANGNIFKNGGNVTGVQKAFELITQGSDVLDALIAGVNILELDPTEDSVGYGGLPNAEGVVQLDSCCMHGPRKQAGGVAALEGVRTPSLVAKAVLEQTDHHLLVGKGAQDFARAFGFKIEDDLNTEHSRALWLEWKRRTDPNHYLDPKQRAELGFAAAVQMAQEGLISREHFWGTINCDGVNAKGEICGVTTTSGLPWKIPGRVGDSPILGAGLYVDGEVGAAGSTGRGEANLYNLSSFLIVEALRRGAHPKDAGMEALKRVASNTVEKRLRTANGQPSFDLNFYILNRKGEYAGVSLYPGHYAVCTEKGPETLETEPLFSSRG
ncbi:MAG TPA: N(4)-(beta-N-acetylglucosaminyl)-L-asparaginase [Thermoanaerobaculia bacterium]|nr:N(4)-(beta-N-acetylglucosaminyl)-L-asparaginase [Thermoanaerobaculia bacterium]